MGPNEHRRRLANCDLDTPPVWHHVHSVVQMGFAYKQRDGIENFAVNISLATKSL